MGKKAHVFRVKKRTREHVIADLSVNHVERHILRCGFAVDRIEPDYGLDLALFTFDAAGNVESGIIWLQLKATDRIKLRRDKRAIAVRLERAHLLSWLKELYPVILVMYDARKDVAYWLYVQQSFAGGKVFNLVRSGAALTVHIPIENVVNGAAIRRFARFKKTVVAELEVISRHD